MTVLTCPFCKVEPIKMTVQGIPLYCCAHHTKFMTLEQWNHREHSIVHPAKELIPAGDQFPERDAE